MLSQGVYGILRGMIHRTFALLSIFAIACSYPSQHDSKRFQPYHFALGTPLDTTVNGPGPWRTDEQKALRAAFHRVQALGPDVLESSEGGADFVVRPFDSSFTSNRKCGNGVGRYHMGSGYGEVDPVCAQGYDELGTAGVHEFGHFIGLPHICQHYEADSSCDGRWRGDAMMNPSISYQFNDGFEGASGSNMDAVVSTDGPSSLDIAAFNALIASHRLVRSSGGSSR